MDYEKEYKKLKEGISKAYIHAQTDSTKSALETILPELKESEDDKMWKLIKKYVHCNISDMALDADHITREQLESWLEKQREQKPIDKIQLGKKYKCIASPRYSAFMTGKIYKAEDQFLCDLMNLCYDCFEQIEDEQKSTDKVEPKFHEGDWVILTIGELSTTLQIVNVDTNKKLYLFNGGSYLPIVDEECFHLWTLADAKDGDVLAFNNDNVVILKDLYSKTTFHSYCHIEDGVFGISKDDMPDWWEGKGFHPATKEQRDTLMKAMADAGYTFDFEKKELKEIEKKPAWSEEDDRILNDALDILSSYYSSKDDIGLCDNINKIENWLESLEDRVQPQSKQEWSEEGKRKINRIYSILWQAADTHAYSTTCRLIGDKECVELQDFLKSLIPQKQWKPSDEQMNALEQFVRSIGESGYYSPYDNNTKLLYSLLEQLKKLKGE